MLTKEQQKWFHDHVWPYKDDFSEDQLVGNVSVIFSISEQQAKEVINLHRKNRKQIFLTAWDCISLAVKHCIMKNDFQPLFVLARSYGGDEATILRIITELNLIETLRTLTK